MPRGHLLVKVLNAALGLELRDFGEARVFLRSPEGSALLEAWLAAHRNDNDPDRMTTEETSEE